MFCSTGNEGIIHVVKLPLLEKAEFTEYCMHNQTVTKVRNIIINILIFLQIFDFQMVISADDRFIITGGIDGSICIWKLLNIEDKAIKFDLCSSNEILISRQILEEKMDQIKNLNLRLKELETEHSYQMRQNDALHSLKMKDIHAEYCNAIEELKIKNEVRSRHFKIVWNNSILKTVTEIYKLYSVLTLFIKKI